MLPRRPSAVSTSSAARRRYAPSFREPFAAPAPAIIGEKCQPAATSAAITFAPGFR